MSQRHLEEIDLHALLLGVIWRNGHVGILGGRCCLWILTYGVARFHGLIRWGLRVIRRPGSCCATEARNGQFHEGLCLQLVAVALGWACPAGCQQLGKIP